MTGLAPTVTIGMPAYQNADTLVRAIQSVQAQTYENWRLVITDDVSDDGSWDIAEKAAQDDPRIEAIRNPRRRHYMNFSTSLEGADTPYFVWLSADDFWAPAFLDKTVSALEAAPEAISALPRWTFSGTVDGEKPQRTEPLDQELTERMRRYLAAPGGTRMYGLMRTQALRSVFPKRTMLAYDWYLMTGLLKRGTQIEVPEVLLFRERTDLTRYAEASDELQSGLFRRFPVLKMSLAAIAAGHIPAANFGNLLRLNLRKHEEYLALVRPASYARRIRLFKWMKLPITITPGKAACHAARQLREIPGRKHGAGRMLERLVWFGDGAAALELGLARQDGLMEGNPNEAFRLAGELGEPDGWFHLAVAQRQSHALSEKGLWKQVLGACRHESEAAREWLAAARNAGDVPEYLDPIVDFHLDPSAS